MGCSAIDLRGVTFKYKNADEPSVCDVSLEVSAGECVVLTGASGCGKTTLTRIVNGLAYDFYEGDLSGSARVCGRDVTEMPSWERARVVGSVFQNPRTQFFNLDTTGEVVFGMENLGVSHGDMHRRYDRVVEELGIRGLMDRGIFQLSGGQKQAVAFASAWANTPAAYVLDEPSSNLDIPSMRRLASFVAKAKKEGAAVLVAEHRLFWLADVADRFVCIRDGRVAGSWSADEFARLGADFREGLGMRSLEQPSCAHLDKASTASVSCACEVRGLSVGYGGDLALNQVNFSFDKGEVVGIVGENGRGKSTLLRCICGLHREVSGQVLFENSPVDAKRRPEKAFLVMQDVDYQLFRTSVMAELAAAARRGNRELEEARALLEELGLGRFSDRHPASLSGGQKQRVVCAMAALSPCDVVLLDEPTSGLDFVNMVRLASLVRRFASEGRAVVVVSHDAEFLSRACDRVVRFE